MLKNLKNDEKKRNDNTLNKNEIDESIEIQNRNYKGDIKDGFIYYAYSKKYKKKDGTIKIYKNIVKRKRGNKLNRRGKDKKPRIINNIKKKKINLKARNKKLINNLNDEQQQKIFDFIQLL